MRYIIQITILCSLIALTACGGGSSGKSASAEASLASSAESSGTSSLVSSVESTAASSLTSNTESSSTSSSDSFPPLTVAKWEGDNQTAVPGAALPVVPKVRVISYFGMPKIGVEVRFAIASGNGSIQNTNVLTDDDGYATPGVWTLGSEKGVQTLTATVTGLEVANFSASALNKSNDITASIMGPYNGTITGDNVNLWVAVNSFYQLASVTASVNGETTALSYITSNWTAQVSLAGKPRGMVNIVITATDVFANSTDIVLSLLLDRGPVVSINTAPLSQTLVQAKTIELSASCTDDNLAKGCTSIVASVNGIWNRVTDYGTASLSQTVDLSAYDGSKVVMHIEGIDSSNQSVYATRTFYIDTSTHLSLLANVSGPILDMADTRILFLDQSTVIPALKILNTATGITETIDSSADFGFDPYNTVQKFAALTPTGALYRYGQPNNHLMEWKAGTKTELATYHSYDAQNFIVAGKWAAYRDSSVQLRDLDAGVSTAINESVSQYDIAANGDMVYTSGSDIHRFRNGSIESITTSGDASAPVTDGTIVVYNKANKIAMHDGTTETLLAATAAAILPRTSYAVAGGYVAYTQQNFASVQQVWRHGPDGEQQITFFGGSSPSTIEGILNDGSILLSYNKKRYLSVPGMPLQEVSSALGRALVRDDKFWLVIGHSVLEVTP